MCGNAMLAAVFVYWRNIAFNNPRMSIFGYDIKTSKDFFVKFLDEREDFLSNPTSSRFAMNCALNGWHLHEWIYNEYKTLPTINAFNTIKDFRIDLIKRCGHLRYFRDLADGSKHFVLGRITNTIVDTEIKEVGEPWGLYNVFPSPTLIVKSTDFQMTFDDILYSVSFFWYTYLSKELNVELGTIFKNYSSF